MTLCLMFVRPSIHVFIYSLHQGNIVDKRSRQRVIYRHMLIRKIEHTYCTGELKSLSNFTKKLNSFYELKRWFIVI